MKKLTADEKLDDVLFFAAWQDSAKKSSTDNVLRFSALIESLGALRQGSDLNIVQ